MNKIIGIIVALVLIVAYTCTFFVDEREKAILLAFGKIDKVGYEPGIHFKLPFPFNEVKKLDGRVLTIDQRPVRFLTKEKQHMVVDSFVKWLIVDEAVYFTATSGGREQNAASLLYRMVDDGLRSEFAKRTVQEVIAQDRTKIMTVLTSNINAKAKELGIKVVDVRIKRIDFPEKISQNVYERMRTERERLARENRSQGEEAATRIRADADAQSQVLVAEAFRDSEIMRGEGDALSTEIYAKAYGRDRDFYRFYRSMEAYKRTFASKGDVMLIDPDSEFFKYFKSANGKSK
ncbi:MAG: protease modulator HflC [endosymbiont of Galathealinum brachiosum]|uniref:Protein HflC n=1 Tax=endosymbiont of Galathealinum brachiosum TaxID=2200906 RepID=A0A370DNB0_9GAMM|nr:MAG: protease modulator HflC [endosymbiont of Galathealinum brachiosum]